MDLQDIKRRLASQSILFAEDEVLGMPAVIGYDKQFKWRWFATQLNTFVVAIDRADDLVDVGTMEAALTEAFAYAKQNYSGWPRGLQSGLGVIVIILSSHLDERAIEYCRELKSAKQWAGFSIPVVADSSTGQVVYFDRKPFWGRIYFQYFESLIMQATRDS